MNQIKMKAPKKATNKPLAVTTNRPLDEPTQEEIAAAAYLIWEQEGRPEGRGVEHWLKAKAQIRQNARRAAQSK
jgi:hypothetical protein